ncbi:hypothetical protein KUL42_36510 [Alteromonas sp. KUL42]|uniref:hypothetical protein n=1 Tax=Alteromonas sp. KUL42 TaxID=2480797 RepID=UPI000AB427F8|nr:hypothetical protein [Alteromonas sp. KUL42]GEA08890.1 hypothetical protein KUL42_36510 [Alteromonas sp. KUL42]
MDDELRLLQEKLQNVSIRLTNFSFDKQSAEALRVEYKLLLIALEKFTPIR